MIHGRDRDQHALDLMLMSIQPSKETYDMANPPPHERDRLRAIAPKLIDYSTKILYGEVWGDPGLSKRDRSLVTVSALIGACQPQFLKVHMTRALGNGVTREELGELITHLAFYVGWPAANAAGVIALEILEESSSPDIA
jgi:4-carboxymuconolactone decarboxylase